MDGAKDGILLGVELGAPVCTVGATACVGLALGATEGVWVGEVVGCGVTTGTVVGACRIRGGCLVRIKTRV